MSSCRIKRNLAPRGETKPEDKVAQAAMAQKLADMIAEREKQDKAFFNAVLTEEEASQVEAAPGKNK
jgi:hypothetical protein